MLRDIRLMVTFYATCAVHESGHIITLLSYGGRIKAVELSGTGIRIIIKKSGMIPVKSSLFILLSGPAANMIVFFMIKLTGCGGVFSLLNLMAAAYNMLPYRSLDGGAVIDLLTEGSAFERTVDTAMIVIKLTVIVCVTAITCLFGSIAMPMLIASIALFIGDIRR